MKTYLIDEDLANAILTYLSKQPYRDVYEMIQHMQSLKESFEQQEQVSECVALESLPH